MKPGAKTGVVRRPLFVLASAILVAVLVVIVQIRPWQWIPSFLPAL
ncbi:MAG: hypothetical protein OXF67_04895 [Cyanobacteria bacterium MAG CAR4_bin_6]|nr:hypothetical protein [Cyanobacteria bacterium MAG CAR4_bin_6]